MRLGILGGSFDPPHVGHLLAASDAFEALSLDHLILVPAAVQPLKVGRARATPEQRLAMTRLLVEGDPRFAVDPVEIERSGLSFTVDTLAAFALRFPQAERFFLVGADVLASFHKWREPDRILELATLAVMVRSGDDPSVPAPPGSVRLETRRVDLSSTEVRDRVAGGRPIRGFVPDAVERYITAHGLYL